MNGDGRMPEDYWVIGAGSSTLISVGAEVCARQGKARQASRGEQNSEVVKVRRGQVNGRVIIVQQPAAPATGSSA